MSSFNFNWLKENFSADLVFFDIGCAGLEDSIEVRKILPQSKIYAFECNNEFKEGNLVKEKIFNINYYHMAIGWQDGECLFYPSDTWMGHKFFESGSILKPNDILTSSEEWTWGQPYKVQCTTLETLCNEKNIHPDFIWIDAQASEQKILSCTGKYKPSAIWAETCEFGRYESETDNMKFKKFMDELGYIEFHYDGEDSLFTLKDVTFTSYIKK